MNKFSRIAALVAMTSIPVLSNAEVEVDTVSEEAIKISYVSNDLLNSYGRSELEQQIRSAASRVCGPQELRSAVSLEQMINNRNCYTRAVEEALKAIPKTSS